MSEENGERTKILSDMDMNKELHKMIKEAALNISCTCPPHGQLGTGDYEPAEFDEDMYKAVIAGAEYGYKEAIKVAKEWLKENALKYDIFIISRNHLLADFEADMNKLFEENKQ